MDLQASDEAIINAIKRSNDPDVEPYRSDDENEGNFNELNEEDDGEGSNNIMPERQRMDPEIEKILNDQQLRQSLSHEGGAATGPKGVIADYKFHQKQEARRRYEKEQESMRSIEKGAVSSGWLQRQLDNEKTFRVGGGEETVEEDMERKEREEKERYENELKNGQTISMRELNKALEDETNKSSHDEIDELLEDDDQYMIQYRQQRLQELKRIAGRTRYGHLREIDVSQYVDAIDKEDSRTAVIIHLYQPDNQQCRILNQYLEQLAHKYRLAKFLCIISTKADPDFDEIALPTLLCYRNKDLVSNLVRITDELPVSSNGMFEIDDLEKLLLDENALIPDDILDSSRLSINGPVMANRKLYESLSDDEDDDDY